jgi:predicted PurR-regulated permease PerM
VDAAVINPLAVGRSLNLHPLVLILGVTIGGGLGGILGMLVSVPAIAVGRAILTTLMDAHRHGRLRRVG